MGRKKRCWTCKIKLFLALVFARVFGLKDLEEDIIKRFEKQK